jgi:nitroimidazol reductase NimA-like FMN-containing flavoprotein (pyridoxamine 5'-phosphate oxidase superfamily)
MPALQQLDPAECERLLRLGCFGRLVVTTPEGPEIFPVNYAVQDDAIVVRVSSRGPIARHGDDAEAVFEIDMVDHEYWSGWSVVARGRGTISADLLHDTAPGDRRVRSWVDEDRDCELRLVWHQLTGRRLGGAR